MADFDVNTITAAGATLIASATAGNKLVIDGCDATTDVLTKAQAVQVSTRPASPGSNTTDVALAGSTDNHVYAYAEFIRGQSTGGDFNSFFLYGHIENAPSVIRVIAVASATAATHLPESGDVTNRTELQFELTFSATDEVVTVADSSMYATRGEVQVLRERVVTTHAEGSATTGDNQTIYGEKTFMDDVSFSNGVTFSDGLSVVGKVECKSVWPIAAGPYTPTIGDEDAVFRKGYFGDMYLESIASLENNGNIVIGSNLMPDSTKTIYIGSHMNPYKSIRSEEFMICDDENEHGEITFNGNQIVLNKPLIPNADSTSSLGTSSYHWQYVFANKIAIADSSRPSNNAYITVDLNDDLEISDPLVPTAHKAGSLGTSGKAFEYVYADQITALTSMTTGSITASSTITTSSSITASISVTAADFYTSTGTFHGNLTGCTPRPTDTTTAPPVGSIFLALVYMDSTSVAVTIHVGEVIDFSLSPLSVPYTGLLPARFKYGTNQNVYLLEDTGYSGHINSGKYAVLTGGDNDHGSSTYSSYVVCLLMRIE